MKSSPWIVIGEVVGTQGNRGEIKVIPHTEFPERFAQMASVRLFSEHQENPYEVFQLESSRFHKDALILKLEGVNSISEATQLRGMLIKVNEEELMPLPAGRFYIHQLVGLNCLSTDGQNLGTIVDVLQTGANDVYVVKPNPGITRLKEILIPVIPDVVIEIDPEQSRVLVDLLDGLLD